LDLADAEKFRKRPYIQLGDTPFAGAVDSITSSYPSAESEIGWGIALILTEIAPSKANDILKHGYQMGVSGIITGQHWATDITAARILSAAMVARLNADPKIRKLLNDAKKELQGNQVVP
jgi:acid phosphatase (class A)